MNPSVNNIKKRLPLGITRFVILELRNRVTQNDITLRVMNSKIFIEILLWSYKLDSVKH